MDPYSELDPIDRPRHFGSISIHERPEPYYTPAAAYRGLTLAQRVSLFVQTNVLLTAGIALGACAFFFALWFALYESNTRVTRTTFVNGTRVDEIYCRVDQAGSRMEVKQRILPDGSKSC